MTERAARAASDVGKRMLAGAVWVVSMRFAVRLLGTVSTVILARLLTPADFGLIALATMLYAALERVSVFSFEIWLIRHPDPGRTHYDTVWTLSILRGLTVAALIIALSAPLGQYFEEPRLSNILLVLGLVAALQGLSNVGIVDFQRQMRFDKDFLMFTVPRSLAVIVTIGLGYLLRNYWALVAGIVVNQVASLALSYQLHSYRPRLGLAHWREAFLFSKWLLLGNWLGFAYLRADTFILGKLAGIQSLGLYSIAREIAELATSELVVPIRRVMLPGYSQLIADKARLDTAFLEGFAVIVFVGLPTAIGVALVAAPLVEVALGPQWLAAIPLVQILSLNAAASVGIANQGPLLVALGHVKTNTAVVAIGVALLIPGVIWAGGTHGLAGAAVAVAIANFVILGISLTITLRLLNLSAIRLLDAAWRSVTATMVMSVVVHEVLAGAFADSAGWQLAIGIGTGALSFAATVLALWYVTGRPLGPENSTLVLLSRLTARLKSNAPSGT